MLTTIFRFSFAIGFLIFVNHPIRIYTQGVTNPSIYSVNWSPDGTHLAVIADGIVYIYNNNYQLIQQSNTIADTGFLVWSPDNMHFAIGKSIWELNPLSPVLNIRSIGYLGSWSSDGTEIAAVSTNGIGIDIFSTEDGNLVRTIQTGEQRLDGIEWSPDDTRFLTTYRNDTIVIIDATRDNAITTYQQLDGSGLGPLEWSPDSTRIAGTLMTQVEIGTIGSVPTANSAVMFTVHIWDAATGNILDTFSNLSQYPSFLRWHPNGIELAGGTATGAIYIWDTQNNTLTDTIYSSGSLSDLTYSSQGGRLTIGNNLNVAQYLDNNRPISALEGRFVETILGNLIETFVPDPSVERLEAIAAACDAPVSLIQPLAAETSALSDEAVPPAALDTFVAQLDALPEDTIPPGCAADLRAVAEAIGANLE